MVSSSKEWLQTESIHSLMSVCINRAPDGTCLLTNSDDNHLRLFNLPTQLYTSLSCENLTEMVITGAENSLLFTK